MKSTAYYIDTRTEITRDFVSRSDVERRTRQLSLSYLKTVRSFVEKRNNGSGDRRSKFNQTPRALI